MRDDPALGDGIGPDGIDGNADDSDGYVDGVDGTTSVLFKQREQTMVL